MICRREIIWQALRGARTGEGLWTLVRRDYPVKEGRKLQSADSRFGRAGRRFAHAGESLKQPRPTQSRDDPFFEVDLMCGRRRSGTRGLHVKLESWVQSADFVRFGMRLVVPIHEVCTAQVVEKDRVCIPPIQIDRLRQQLMTLCGSPARMYEPASTLYAAGLLGFRRNIASAARRRRFALHAHWLPIGR
jgi:hypothetical protein